MTEAEYLEEVERKERTGSEQQTIGALLTLIRSKNAQIAVLEEKIGALETKPQFHNFPLEEK